MCSTDCNVNERIVLKHDISPEWEDNKLYSALKLQSRKNYDEIKTLIKSGDDVNFKDRDDRTLLHLVALIPYCEWSVIKAIIDCGLDVNARDKNNSTPLHFAAVYPSTNFIFVHELLKCGAEVNARDDKGNTPLHLATRPICKWSVIKKLIESGARVNVRNNEGSTPLHLAIKYCNIDSVAQLLSCGVDVNTRDGEGFTALQLALKAMPETKVIKDLVEAGAGVNDRDAKGNSCLYMASQADGIYLMGVMVVSGEFSILNKAISSPREHFHSERAKDLDKIACSQMKDSLKFKLLPMTLHDATKDFTCNVHIIKEILTTGIKVDNRDYFCMSPLHHAAENQVCNADVFRVLIEEGAFVNAVDFDGNSPLHYALLRRKLNLDVIEVLLQKGCKVGCVNRLGENTFHCALKNKSIKDEVLLTCLKMMVKYGILQNEYLSQEICQKLVSKFPEMSSYKLECLSEARIMKRLMLSDNVSLFEFVGKVSEPNENREQEIFNILLSHTHSFSIYKDMIWENVDKKFFLDQVLAQQPLEASGIVLKPDCFSYVADFLSKEDLICLFKAFMDSN